MVEEVNQNKRLMASVIKNENVKSSSVMVNAINKMTANFMTVVEAYRTLAARLEMIEDLQEIVNNNKPAPNLVNSPESFKHEMVTLIRKEVAEAVSQQFTQAAQCVSQENVAHIIANEMKQAVSISKASVTPAPRKSPPTSFAEIFRQGLDSGKSSSTLSAKTQTNAIEFLVVPMIGFADKFNSSTEIRNKFRSVITPTNFGLRVRHLITLNTKKAVKVIAESVNLEKLSRSEELRIAGLAIETRPKLRPRLIIKDVPTDIAPDRFIPAIVAGNSLDAGQDDIKLVYRYPVSQHRKGVSCVIKTSAKVRDKLMSSGRVYIEFYSCRIEEHILIKQCYNCLSFGHIAKDCQKPKICSACAGPHSSKDCRDNLNLKCHNCSTAKLNDTAHSATNSTKCPILMRRIEEKARSINYVDE